MSEAVNIADGIFDPPEEAFKRILECERSLSSAKAELQKAETIFGGAVNRAEKDLKDAWEAIEGIMAQTGEYEILLPGENGMDYKIAWSTPRQSVKIVDDAAVPDEFCRVKREPDKKKIKEELESGAKHNWAALEYGEKHLTWKAIKHGK